ncbi:endonuclease [Streptomyces phage Psst1]|nr:endonuclease [Streptomyces phage Psst1]WPJ30693.1 endonuclease [Streptomyces phage Psst2]
MLERDYQKRLIETLEKMFPGCFILKNDPGYLQGVPDLLILYGGRWAMLEVKANAKAPSRPNQNYYIELLNGMSFAAFIHPSNEQEVLDALRAEFQV